MITPKVIVRLEDPSRRELQRAASIRRIVDAAERLVSEAAYYADISVEQVISRAGTSRSTFYSYFEDMGHVLRVVSEGVVGEVVGSARQWMDLDTDISELQLRAIFSSLFVVYRRRAKLLAALAEASTYDAGVRDEFHAMLSIGHVELAKHIGRAQIAGIARADIDPGATAGWLVWMIERGLYQQVRLAAKKDLERHAGSLASIVWHALYESPR